MKLNTYLFSLLAFTNLAFSAPAIIVTAPEYAMEGQPFPVSVALEVDPETVTGFQFKVTVADGTISSVICSPMTGTFINTCSGGWVSGETIMVVANPNSSVVSNTIYTFEVTPNGTNPIIINVNDEAYGDISSNELKPNGTTEETIINVKPAVSTVINYKISGNGMGIFACDSGDSGDSVTGGTVVSCIATPDSNEIVTIMNCPSSAIVSTETECTFEASTTADETVDLEAIFEPVFTTVVNYSKSGNGTGTFTCDSGASGTNVLGGTIVSCLATPGVGNVSVITGCPEAATVNTATECSFEASIIAGEEVNLVSEFTFIIRVNFKDSFENLK